MAEIRLADPSASRAVLAGIWDYEHMEPLPAVARNVTGLADALADPRIWGLPRQNISIVQPGDVRDGFIRTITKAAEEATDTLLVYFAGHGINDDFSDELYLGLPGTRENELDTALRYEFISRRLRPGAAKAKHVVVILDCCFSGLAVKAGMSAGQRLADLAAISSRAVFTASAETKRAMAPIGAAYTAFTGVLLDLLDHGIPGEPELLTMQTLHVHAHTLLRNQRPELGSRGGGGLVCIAKNTQPATTAPASRTPVVVIPAQPPELPSRMPALIRQLLLGRHGRIKGLTVVGPGLPTPAWLTKERPWFGLAKDEELIGVWRWPAKPLFFPRRGCRLLFTSRGVRIQQDSSRMMFPYTNFKDTYFSSSSSIQPSYSMEMGDVYYAQMSIRDASQSWHSPDLGAASAVVHGLAAVLEDIKAIATGSATRTATGNG
ncbi:caspase family protein [Streptomyces sp. NBC_00555]|uniref:caspase family protein n=1 Tax=Streptomyces sp. NBC_00555 TaxID=2903662 RepID=UPI0022518EC9|nr:caspase family protein [Streptomyces sp. NBC_00555]MCX5012467.1 caspase family protein [Streptomyces sp. NBC_00555]